MWLVLVYDCPTTTPGARHDYSTFHKDLLRQNFVQLQKSVYVRHYPTMAAAEAAIARLSGGIPEEAAVAFFMITDKQYGLTREFFGPKSSKKKPDVPEQVGLFV